MAVPCTLPLIAYVPLGSESVIDPFNLFPVWVQWSVNMPETAPLYCPDHVPARWDFELAAANATVPPQQTARQVVVASTGQPQGKPPDFGVGLSASSAFSSSASPRPPPRSADGRRLMGVALARHTPSFPGGGSTTLPPAGQ